MYSTNKHLPKIRRDVAIFAKKHGIRKASTEEISQIPGIGEKIAAAISEHLSHVGVGNVNTTTGEIS